MDAIFDISPAPGILTNKIGIKAYETTSPSVEVASVEYDPPHTAERQVIIPGLNAVPHIIKIYNTPGFPTLGTLIHEFWLDVDGEVGLQRVFFVVDGPGDYDPVNGSSTFTSPEIEGLNITGLFQRAFGYLLPDTEWEHVGDTITLLSGYTFSGGDTWCYEVTTEAANDSPGSGTSSGGGFGDIVEVTDDLSLDSSYRNKSINCNGVDTRLVITLEQLSSLPDGTTYYFFEQTGNQYQTKIVLGGSDTISHFGVTKTYLVLGKGEHLFMKKSGSAWVVLLQSDARSKVGIIEQGYIATPNKFKCEGALGDGDDYPAIWQWLSQLPTNQKIVDAGINGSWTHPAEKKGMFAVTGGSDKYFRWPDLRDEFIRGLSNFTGFGGDSNRLYDYPGGQQEEQVGEHDHTVSVGGRDYNRMLTVSGTSTVDSPDNTPGEPNLALSQPMSDLAGQRNRPANTGLIYFVNI